MRLFFLSLLIIACNSSFSQVPFERRFQHNGRYDFTMIGASLNSEENTSLANCSHYDLPTPPSASLSLDPDQNIIAAYLYWSANMSGSTNSDETVLLNGINVNSERTYTSDYNQYDFFGCTANVTSIIQNQGNGSYTVEGLNTYRADCTVSYAGWAIVVVFEDTDLSPNTVNIYDGFRNLTQGGSVSITVDELQIVQQFGSYVGILAWEGDRNLPTSENDISAHETVEFNGNQLGGTASEINPYFNIFNGTNTFTGEAGFHNMDMDLFDISDYVDIGDDVTADITARSGQDLVIFNALAFTINSELPEATIEILNAESDCVDDQINVEFEVRNFNANDILPSGTIIHFFVNENDSSPEATLTTTSDIPIGGSQSLQASLPYPAGNPSSVTIFATINLDTNGDRILQELNYDNNRHNLLVDVAQPPQIAIDRLEECDQGSNTASFDLDALISQFQTDNPNITISIHENQDDAENNNAALTGNYPNTSNPQTLYARQTDLTTACVGVMAFELRVNPNPQSTDSFLQECSDNDQATFTLSDADSSISNESGIAITYHETPTEADSGDNPLPNNYSVTGTTTVYARTTFTATSCYSNSELELRIFANPEDIPLQNESLCESDNNGSESFDLTSKMAEILGSQDPANFSVTFHNSLNEAQNGTGAIADPVNFANTSNPQTIYVRIENNANTTCFITQEFDIAVNQNPPANDVPISVPTCSGTNTAVFDLTAVALEVAADDPSMVVDFFEDVDLQTQITTPNAYTSQGALTTVYGRVTNPTTGCFSIGQVQLQVLANPERRDQSLTECATDVTNSEAVFDLSTLTGDIINNAQNVVISYHTSFADADAATSGGLNQIPNPTSFSSPTAVIYARSEADYQGTRCHTVSEVSLTVNPRPTAIETTYPLCSNVNTQDFDLTTQESAITGGASGVTLTYYSDSGLQTQITNTSSYTSATSTIYVSVVDDVTGCSESTPLHLEVIINPELTEDFSLEQCLSNGVASFDLSPLQSQLENDYPNLNFSFYEDEMATTPISGTSVNATESRSVYLRYEINGTSCFRINEVSLNVPQRPIEDFGDVIICLSNGHTLPDGTQVFDTGLYEVIIQDSITGCDITTTTNLIVGEVVFPTAFAPNGNNTNEGFGPIPGEECVGEVTDFYMVIYNRWGEKVFETNDFIHRWDGRFNGELVDGAYLWRSTYTFQGENVERNGTVVLLF